jgi:hypothetical protein
MDANTFNLGASIASIILAVVAIWQAVHFYSQGKNTESRVETALSAIKAQVETLQSINGKTLDRLTKYVTTPREDSASQMVQALSSTLRELPGIVQKLQLPANAGTRSDRNELIRDYLVLWYYAGTTNVWASFNLPPIHEFDENTPNHALIKQVIDRSAADFLHMTGVINQIGRDEIASTTHLTLYQEIQDRWLPLVGDTDHHLVKQSKSHVA